MNIRIPTKIIPMENVRNAHISQDLTIIVKEDIRIIVTAIREDIRTTVMAIREATIAKAVISHVLMCRRPMEHL